MKDKVEPSFAKATEGSIRVTKSKISTLIDKIQIQNTDFKLAEIEGVLYEIQNKPGITFEQLVSTTGIPSKSLKTLLTGMTTLVTDNSGSYDLQSQDIKYKKYNWCTFDLEDKELEQKIIDIRKK
jgi:hypothetical protein